MTVRDLSLAGKLVYVLTGQRWRRSSSEWTLERVHVLVSTIARTCVNSRAGQREGDLHRRERIRQGCCARHRSSRTSAALCSVCVTDSRIPRRPFITLPGLHGNSNELSGEGGGEEETQPRKQ